MILGNFIGTDVTGAKSLPTNLLTVAGLHLASTGASPQGVNNTVGGTTPEARNVISGNNGAGVFFAIPVGSSSQSASNSNVVVGNYIGTDLTGTKAVPNLGDGVYDAAGANNTIGGTTPGGAQHHFRQCVVRHRVRGRRQRGQRQLHRNRCDGHESPRQWIWPA